MNFTSPLPIPADAIVLTDSEKVVIRKYLDRVEAAKTQAAIAHESLNDVCMAIAARVSRTESNFKISADLGCLIPSEE